jgi:acyl carrier protein
MSYREKIRDVFHEILEQNSLELLVEELMDDTVLLESGLDSLGFAILVAQLEMELDLDPFILMGEPVYPTTFGEFVAIYDQHL